MKIFQVLELFAGKPFYLENHLPVCDTLAKIYIIMEVLPKIKYHASVGAHLHFADFVRFAGPIGSPMKCSKWKKFFPAYGGHSVRTFQYLLVVDWLGSKWNLRQGRRPDTFRWLCPLRRAYWLAHEVFQVKKIFPRIWRSLCAHFSISVSSRSIGIKVKSAPRKEARHISPTLSASQGLLARPWSVPSEKRFSPHMAVALCALYNICY